MEKVKFTAREDLTPKCPHCENNLDEVYFKVVWKFLFAVSVNGIFFCPHCLKVLSCGQSRP